MANICVIDTETAPLVNHKDNAAHPETALVYDLGYCIYDHNQQELVARSFIISDTFNNPQLMNSAYYADKVPMYRAGASMDNTGAWQVVSFLEAWTTFQSDCKLYDVRTVWAYNINFDKIALNHTLRHYSNGFARFFFPYKIKLRDIWDYASCITGTKTYIEFCTKHDYFTPNGNPQTSAETVYRFITKDKSFIEDHTALSDARIEYTILQAAKKKHAKTRHSSGQGWRDAAAKHKELY